MPKKRKPRLMTPEEGLALLRPVDAIERLLLARRGHHVSPDYAPHETRVRQQFAELFKPEPAAPRRGS